MSGVHQKKPGQETSRTVLVVDDEPMVVEIVRRYLQREGFAVVTASSGDQALTKASDSDVGPDLVILDVMLPGLSGVEVCRRLRKERGVMTPIILLTARGEESERIDGLSAGADDYVMKPFSPGELMARVHAHLRRVEMDAARGRPAHVLEGGDVVLDAAMRVCTVRGKPVALTPKEFDLLHALMANSGHVLSRDELLDRVWDERFTGHSTVTVHVRRVREKIEVDPDLPSHIKTVWGLGYKFDSSPHSPEWATSSRS
jgi:DNA-binding response OmpR family regulator